MPRRTPSVRQEQAALTARLRSKGKTWPQIADAFRTRYRVNVRVALRLAHGFTQQDVADIWNERWPDERPAPTSKYVSRWEQWPTLTGWQPSLAVLSRLAEIYQCSVADLVTDCSDYRHLDEATAHEFKQPVTADLIRPTHISHNISVDSSRRDEFATLLELTSEDDNEAMKRRAFLMDLATTAGIGAVGPLAGLETMRHSVNQTLAEQPAAGNVDDWQEIVQEYGQTYLTTAPRELLGSLLVDLYGLQSAVARYSTEAAQRDLRQVGAMLCAFTAQTIANLGHLREARRWWRSARRAADESGDPYTALWIRGCEIVRAGYERRPLTSILQLIEDSEARMGSNPPPAAMPTFLAGKAQTLALLGESARPDAEATLVRLRKAFDVLPSPHQAARDSTFGWGEERLRFTESLTYTYLGDHRRAEAAQNRALVLHSRDDLRRPAQIELQRALCLVGMGDVEQGVRHAQAVVSRLPDIHRVRPIADLGHKVLRAVPAGDQHQANVNEYREFLDASFTTTTRELTGIMPTAEERSIRG
jgi:transcriptional regulator with XRE-family HTH domain